MKTKEDQYNSEITEQEKEMLNQENLHNDGGDDQDVEYAHDASC